jgi:hypothetical protein
MFRIIVFNTTFNNISVISWRSVPLVEETGVPGENRRPVVSYSPFFALISFGLIVWDTIDLFDCKSSVCDNDELS